MALYRPFSVSPTACPLHGNGCAGIQSERLNGHAVGDAEIGPVWIEPHVFAHVFAHICTRAHRPRICRRATLRRAREPRPLALAGARVYFFYHLGACRRPIAEGVLCTSLWACPSLTPKPSVKALCESLMAKPHGKASWQSLMSKHYAKGSCSRLLPKPYDKALCQSLKSKP